MSSDRPDYKEVAAQLRAKIEKYRRWKEAQVHGKPAPPHTDLKLRVGVPYLEAALKRIEEGAYGTCLDCGEEIPTQRLEAVIGALRCTQCQLETEKIDRNRGFSR